MAREARWTPAGHALPVVPRPEGPRPRSPLQLAHRARGPGLAARRGAGGLLGPSGADLRKEPVPRGTRRDLGRRARRAMMHGADHRPVRVLHVFSNFVPSGPELRAIRLIEALGPRFLHAVVSMDGRTTAAAHLSDPGLIRILPSPPKAGSLATVRRLRRILAEEDPDLVLSYGWGAIDTLPAAASLRLRSLVHHEEGFNADEALTFKRRRVWARRLLLPAAHHVVVPSRRLHAIATGLWKVAEERVRLIPNGIPTDSFPRADRDPEFRLRLRIPRDAFLVGTVAQLRPVKNIGRLIDA